MKPILFNTEMVQAILDDRKTVTRRVVKPQPQCYGPSLTYKHEVNLTDVFLSAEKGILQCRRCGHYPEYSNEGSLISHYWKPPYKVADILYVRETWAKIEDFENHEDWEIDKDLRYLYKCDDNGKQHTFIDIGVKKWKLSIHMPSEAARIFLKVTDIRVEKLQDITLEQVYKEGILDHKCDVCKGFGRCKNSGQYSCFEWLWDGTVKKQDIGTYDWNSNPYVWVIEFERVDK